MKVQQPKKKLDLVFVIAIVSIVVLALTASGLAQLEKKGIEPQPLPAEQTININKLVISEIMSNNGGVFMNDENRTTDYLEIYNGKSEAVNLKGYGLSDRTDSVKWVFSDCILNPGEYVVVALTGKLQAGLNAAFKLSSKGGETVMLVNPNSKVIDAVETVALGKNQSMMRDGDGKWFVSEYGTPGYPNTMAGLEAYYESLKGEAEEELVINEFLARNKGNFMNKDGVYAGFIEFINVSDHVIDMSEYTLGDTVNVPFRHTFEAVQLAPKEVYSVYLGDSSLGKEKYIGFKFDNNNGTIVLSKHGKIVQSFKYDNLPNGTAIVRSPEGDYFRSSVVSPGKLNTPGGISSFQSEYLANPKDLMINELMSSNRQYLKQNGNNYYDWVEIKNNSDQEINLAEYCLAKDLSSLAQYPLPEKILKPGEIMVFMASGNTDLTNNSYYHMPFKIGTSDSVYLSKAGVIIDSVNVVDLPYGYSYGRGTQNGFFYFSKPTPKAENSDGTRSMVSTPEFTTAAGIYDDVSNVVVEIKGEGTIYYTTDGSIPSSNSKKYSGPFTISKTTVVKARAYQDGALRSNYSVASYIINEKHTVPVVSVSMAPSDFSYINNRSGVVGIERQAYVELYEKEGSFSLPCSFACFGGNTRFYSKKSYALRFGSEWGESDLKYQVFKNRDNSVYKALVLRSGSTDWTEAYMRDILGTSLVDDYTDVDVQAYKIVVVYVNGRYWGLYNLREKINKHFISEHYNVDADSVNLARIDGDVQSGSKKGYNDLRSYARNHNIANEANYRYIIERLDIINFIDYWIAETYVTNNDIVNCRFFQSSQIDGKWRYIFYDLDFAWYNKNQNYYVTHLTNPRGIGNDGDFENDLLRALFKNSTFRNLWLERLSYHMKNTWNTKVVTDRINELYAVLQPEMRRNCSRWGISYDYWVQSVRELKTYASVRGSKILTQTKSFFGLSDARMKQLFGDMW